MKYYEIFSRTIRQPPPPPIFNFVFLCQFVRQPLYQENPFISFFEFSQPFDKIEIFKFCSCQTSVFTITKHTYLAIYANRLYLLRIVFRIQSFYIISFKFYKPIWYGDKPITNVHQSCTHLLIYTQHLLIH